MRTNGIKIWSTINQSNCIIRTFDLRRTLPKYLRTFLHENAVLTIGLTDQLGYSICLLYGQSFHPYSVSKNAGFESIWLLEKEEGGGKLHRLKN